MVNVLVLKAVDCGFIGGIMVSVLVWKVDKHANPPPMNPRSTAFETSTLNSMPLD
jgi:hypothetical protein